MTKRGLVAVLSTLVAAVVGSAASTAAGDGGDTTHGPSVSAAEARAFDPSLEGGLPTPTIRLGDLPAVLKGPSYPPAGNTATVRPDGWEPDPSDTFDRDAVSRAVRIRAGDRWAGEWVDRSGPEPAYVYGIVDATSADEQYVRSLVGDAPVVVSTRRYSLLQLDAWANRVLDLANRYRLRPSVVDVDEQSGMVVLEAPSVSRDARRELAALVPAQALRIVEHPLSAGDDHSSPDAWRGADGKPWYEAGLRIYLSNNRKCATAFYVFQSLFGPFGLTAGHCPGYRTSGTGVWSGDGSFTDWIRANVYDNAGGEYSDAATFWTATAVNNPRIFCQTSACHWGVMGVFTSGYPSTGESICLTSIELARNTCGTVSRARFWFTDPNGVRSFAWSAPLPSASGDSGGPWYRYYTNGTVRAAGVHKGRLGNDAVMTHIYYATSQTNTYVVTQ